MISLVSFLIFIILSTLPKNQLLASSIFCFVCLYLIYFHSDLAFCFLLLTLHPPVLLSPQKFCQISVLLTHTLKLVNTSSHTIQVLFKQFLLLWDLGQVNLCGNSWRTVSVSHRPPALPDISCAGFQTRCYGSSSSSCKCSGWGAGCGACTSHASVGTNVVMMFLLLLGSLHWRCGFWSVGVGSIHVSWCGLFFTSVVAENLFCFSLFSETVLDVVVIWGHPWEEVSSASSYSVIFISNILTLHSKVSMTFFFLLLSLLFQIFYFHISC